MYKCKICKLHKAMFFVFCTTFRHQTLLYSTNLRILFLAVVKDFDHVLPGSKFSLLYVNNCPLSNIFTDNVRM